jgi:hypothetical protein
MGGMASDFSSVLRYMIVMVHPRLHKCDRDPNTRVVSHVYTVNAVEAVLLFTAWQVV